MNLYKVELMKIKLSSYIWAIFFIYSGILTLSIFMLFISAGSEPNIVPAQIAIRAPIDIDETNIFTSWNGMLSIITALSFACYSIFSAVIAAKIIVAEYCGKDAAVLLSYPIKRKHILQIKCLIVCALTVTSTLLSNLSIVGVVYIISLVFRISLRLDAAHFIVSVMFSSILAGILTSALGLISSVIGMKKRSIMTTIVCALLLVCLTTNAIAISPKNIVLVMLAMAVFFVAVACWLYHLLVYEISRMEV